LHIFDRFGWSSGKANPFAQFYSIGVGGTGIIPNRDNGTFGVGYCYLKMSDDLPDILDISDGQGVAIFCGTCHDLMVVVQRPAG